MKIIETDRGAIAMGDVWDYKLRKVEMVWDLAMRVIPKNPEATGRWTEDGYLENAQKTLEECHKIIDAVFAADKGKI